MTEQPYGPREITDRFDALTKQLDRMFAILEDMRRDSQLQFAALDNKFVTKDALQSEVKLLNQRQTDWEHQRDLQTDGWEKEKVVQERRFNDFQKDLDDIEARWQKGISDADAQRKQYRIVLVGQFVYPVLVALVAAFLLGALK